MASRPLRIGVDGRELLGRPTGVGRYLWQVLRQWTADPAWPHQLSIFIPGDPPPAAHDLGARVHWCSVPDTGSGTWWEQRKLPGELRRHNLDVFFAAGYTAPLYVPCPFVVAIYDVSFFAHPEWFRAREGVRRRWLTRSAARRAGRVVTISEFSAGEIVRWLGVGRDHVVLAPPGAPDAVAGTGDAREPLVLYVGSLFNRRHIPDLIEGFSRTAREHPEARLVLVGDNRTAPPIDPRALADRSGVGGRVEWREYIQDDALEDLYRAARVFVFLSEYEGFGMTPIEAIAHGVPPVLLDTPVSREVYGEAARLVAPTPDAIGSALSTLLADDRAHAALLSAGQHLLGRFTWKHAAQVIQTALEDAAP